MEPGVGVSQGDIVENLLLCYESVNGSCKRTIIAPTIRAVLYLFLGTMSVLTVCGNLVLIITIIHFKQLHTPTNYLILSLAVSDLLLGAVVMFPSMIRYVETCWYFGDLFCKIHSSFDVMLCATSILNLSLISIDRHYAVCDPLRYRSKITGHIALVMIMVSWGVSAIVGFGIIFLGLNILGVEEFYYDHVACEGGCIMFFTAVSSTVTSILTFYIPGVIMLCIYFKIFLVAQRQARSIQNTTCQTSRRMADKSQRKATKTLAIIMGAFLAFWMPFFVCNFINPFINYSISTIVIETLIWIGYSNSILNPMIYAFFYSWFRRAFRMIILGNIFQPDSSMTKLYSE